MEKGTTEAGKAGAVFGSEIPAPGKTSTTSALPTLTTRLIMVTPAVRPIALLSIWLTMEFDGAAGCDCHPL